MTDELIDRNPDILGGNSRVQRHAGPGEDTDGAS